MVTFFYGVPFPEPKLSIFLTTSIPSNTFPKLNNYLPKTTCFPFNQLVPAVVIKN